MPSANDEFPRGWIYPTRFPVGNQAQITIPAAIGVTRVFTDIQAWLVNATGAGMVDVVVGIVNLYDLTNNNPLIELGTNNIAAAQMISGQWSGKLLIPTSSGAIVSFNVGVPGVIEGLLIQGYDI